MKKKLSLLLAAIMVISMLPMSAFAATTNSISRTPTVSTDDKFTTNLEIEAKSTLFAGGADEIIQLTLTGSELDYDSTGYNTTSGAVAIDVLDSNGASVIGTVTANIDKIGDKSLLLTMSGVPTGVVDTIIFPIYATAKDEGVSQLTIVDKGSVISQGTYSIANISEGDTTTTIEKKTDVESSATIKDIIITETSGGVLKTGILKLKLSSNWEFVSSPTFATLISSGASVVAGTPTVNDDEILIPITVTGTATKAGMYSIVGITVKATDDADVGDIADITLSGISMSKATIEVATKVDYGYSWKAVDKDLPVMISGLLDNDDNTLKVTFKETVTGSWLSNRKTVIEFPEDVKVIDIDITSTKNLTSGAANTIETAMLAGVNKNKIDFSAGSGLVTATKKAEIEIEFKLSVSPNFTGDITATISGNAVGGEATEVTCATAIQPVTVATETNEVRIDYRNVEINDITITENVAGALEKDQVLWVYSEYMTFEDDFDYEVVSGDLKIDSVKVASGVVKITIKSSSSKEASVIKLSNLKLYLNRSLPTGTYNLQILADSFTNSLEYDGTKKLFNSTSASTSDSDLKKYQGYFEDEDVIVLDKFIEVITAGRDQDDSTFTTTISVTIGATEMYAGTQVIDLTQNGAPAYISNGYTMLPVRAVTVALSGTAIISWDDGTKTATILFGSRVISMTVGQKSMVINGTSVAMSAAPEITDSRVFIPLRDLGYALGLSDNKINWDEATKTATLN